MKKQLPSTYRENFLTILRPPKITYKVIPNILSYLQFYTKLDTLPRSLMLFLYLRAHLIDRCMKQVETKRRCSQTQC